MLTSPEIPWWEWLLAPGTELKRLGVDPRLRGAKTGHIRAFHFAWARSVGLWGVASAETIQRAVGHRAQTEHDRQRIRYAYDVFKVRHKLWSDRQLMKALGLDATLIAPFGRVRLATELHARMHYMREQDPSMSLGAAAALAVSPVDAKKYPPIGVLPIEAMRYYLAIEHILEDTAISIRKWIAEIDAVSAWEWRRLQWDRLDCDLFVLLPEEALQKYDPPNEEG